MELTRRDAIRAVVATGVVSGGALAVSEGMVDRDPGASDAEISTVEEATMRAVAEVLYPSQVEVTAEFVRTYLRSLDDTRRPQVVRALRDLNEHAERTVGTPFHRIEPVASRERVLRSTGADRAASSPDGTLPARIRYHLVNSLLYALFTTPKGSELFGIRNPVGHPGGFATYRRQLEADE